MKTLSELKAIAKTNLYEAKLIYRYGEEIPERLIGWRKIVGSNSVAIFLLNNEGKQSELRVENASLIEFNDSVLSIFEVGERELNEEEKEMFRAWKAITDTEEYKKQDEIDALSDGSQNYYKKKSFFGNAEYMLGHDFSQGKRYNHNTSKMYDKKVKGKIILQYEIRKVGE